MNKTKIEQNLNKILQAANAIPVQGEGSATNILVICRAAREVWEQVNVADESTQQRGNET